MDENLSDVTLIPVFDSWSDHCPELRDTKYEYHHLIYEGGGVILDLLLKETGQGATLQLSGHLLPSRQSLVTSGLKVELKQGNQHYLTRTNRLGEFSFEIVPNRKFDLAIIFSNAQYAIRGLSNHDPHLWRVELARGASVSQ